MKLEQQELVQAAQKAASGDGGDDADAGARGDEDGAK